MLVNNCECNCHQKRLEELDKVFACLKDELEKRGSEIRALFMGQVPEESFDKIQTLQKKETFTVTVKGKTATELSNEIKKFIESHEDFKLLVSPHAFDRDGNYVCTIFCSGFTVRIP